MNLEPQPQHTSRRALFPSESPLDSDLDGSINPLPSDDEAPSLFLTHTVGDYDIIGLVAKTALSVDTPTPPPAKSHPPSSDSPSQTLKTPQDTSDNTKFPKLVRKSQTEAVASSDSINPKVRMALFPDCDISLPSKSFYPKGEKVEVRGMALKDRASPKKGKKKQALYLCNRKSRYRSGQINAGVRHKIKKRKIKKLNKSLAIQAAINIIENSPLNSFLEPKSPLPPPPSPPPDPTKKFFKSARHKAIVTVSPNIRIEMNNGRLSLLPNQKSRKRPRAGEPANSKRFKADFEGDTPLIPEKNISEIISSLEDKENDVLMSPTSQMCNMTSGLALNSPKKARDLSELLDKVAEKEEAEEGKLFPVFYPGKTVQPTKVKESKGTAKKFKVSKDQMLLDAGQKKWGATQCTECRLVYHVGDPVDEITHLNFHNGRHIFKFNGWKNERVVFNSFANGRIIQIVPGDPKIWWKKVKEVLQYINKELGNYDMEFNTSNLQVFIYVQNKNIVGLLAAEVKSTAYKMLSTDESQVDLCSEEAFPIKCGVSRIWVSQMHRKKGIATALMDSLKRNFMFGCILKNEDVALSSPTDLGKSFGRGYFKTDRFLIYFA